MPHCVHGGAPLTDLSLLFTLLIKPEPCRMEGNLCSWMCSFPPALPSRAAVTRKAYYSSFSQTFPYRNALFDGCPGYWFTLGADVSTFTLLCSGPDWELPVRSSANGHLGEQMVTRESALSAASIFYMFTISFALL